ncbi:MAG: preprotein translocase subunit YajC [Pseudomonadota bacterium]|jgi:preprotein translocase subunit YajC
MNFLIQQAWAEGAPAAPQMPNLIDFLPLIVLFAVFYFLLIRPQTKRVKEHKQMVDNLAKGDEVVTTGGLLGKIIELGDNFVVIEVAQDVQLKVQRPAIGAVMPKGTMKTL